MMQFFISGLVTAVLLFCGSCKKGDKVTSYQIPKEELKINVVQSEASRLMQQSVGRSLEAEAETNTIVAPNWVAPVGWAVLPSDALKKGNFQVKDREGRSVEITVIGFQGNVGGELANINRWRQQVGLGPVDADFMKSLATTEVDGRTAKLIDIEGSAQKSIYGAILERDGQSWFFKMMGDAALVKKEKENFLKFLESVKFTK